MAGADWILEMDGGSEMDLQIDRPIIQGTFDYEDLENLPELNGTELIGNLTGHDLGLQDVLAGTTEYWNSQLSFIPPAGQIVIYTDHGTVDDGSGGTKNVPGIRIGDGLAYAADLPFVGEDVAARIMSELEGHIEDGSIHVSELDRSKWDNKLNCDIDGEILVLNRN